MSFIDTVCWEIGDKIGDSQQLRFGIGDENSSDWVLRTPTRTWRMNLKTKNDTRHFVRWNVRHVAWPKMPKSRAMEWVGRYMFGCIFINIHEHDIFWVSASNSTKKWRRGTCDRISVLLRLYISKPPNGWYKIDMAMPVLQTVGSNKISVKLSTPSGELVKISS